jgi:hypothetical protein
MPSDSRYLATVRRAISMPARAQAIDDHVVGQDGLGGLGADQLLDQLAYRFRRMSLAALGSGDGA